jgi:hypothetical protein
MTDEVPDPAGPGDDPAPMADDGEPAGRDVLEARWSDVLDDLENDIVAAEHVLARNRAEEIAAWSSRSGDWVAPASLGSLPDELRTRAAQLLQHQLEVAERLVERITQSQRQRDLTARMRFASKPVAAYFDEAI